MSLYGCGQIILPDYVKEKLKNGIPEVDNEKLLELYVKVKPLITVHGEKHLLDDLSLDDLESLSYLSLEKNNMSRALYKCKKVDLNTLKEIKDFICLHKFGFSLQFRPSVSGILAQIPDELISQIDAFEIVERPVLPNDLYRYREATDKNYHLSRVMTYKIK